MKTHSKVIDGIACAFHCPPEKARYLHENRNLMYKCLNELGPMRAHWSMENQCWMVFNRKAGYEDIVEHRYRLERENAVR